MSASRSRPFLAAVGRFCLRLGCAVARGVSSPVAFGLLLALYGLATHYVEAMRQDAPWRIDGWFDVKSQIGNVFHSAALNARDLLPNLFHHQWAEAIGNLTNLAGVRSDAYTRVFYADAINDAEAFVIAAPVLMLVLIAGRLLRGIFRAPAPGISRASEAIDRSLVYVARAGLASAACTVLLLNAVGYYQGLSGFAGIIGYAGSALATVIDAVATTGATLIKEVLWHLVLMLTDGKEKTLGLLTRSPELEHLSHYLARFPSAKINAALHTATYQALAAGALLGLAHARQRRLVRTAVRSSRKRKVALRCRVAGRIRCAPAR